MRDSATESTVFGPSKDIEHLLRLGDSQTPYEATPEEQGRVAAGYERLQTLLAQKQTPIYGTTTHFGRDVTSHVDDNWESHQRHLVSFLTVGTGKPLPEPVVRRALRIQAKKIGRGLSGTSPTVFQQLIALSNQPQLPTVPAWGSLGASGDLIPMAHAVAPLISEGSTLGPRDALSLVNTNAMMVSFALETLQRVYRIIENATHTTALASLGLGCSAESFAPDILGMATSHPATIAIASHITSQRNLLAERLGVDPITHAERPIQERYSIRCAPQVLGAGLAQLQCAADFILQEAHAITDNPLIIDLPKTPHAWHGGMFYTAFLAAATDMMLDATSRATELVERQTFLLVDPHLSGNLPRNLATAPDNHIKGIHQLVNALGQTVRSHALPSRFLAAPAEGYNQDVVPATMATLLSLEAQLDAAEELIRGAHFIAERGATLRLCGVLPRHLDLDAWKATS